MKPLGLILIYFGANLKGFLGRLVESPKLTKREIMMITC